MPPDVIYLLDGTRVPTGEITLQNNSFFWKTRDITRNMRFSDMRSFSGFDGERFLRELSDAKARNEGKTAVVVGSTSTWGIFADQLLTDPLAAPVAALDKGVNQLVGSTGIKTTLAVGFAAVAVLVIAVVFIKQK